jgi:hypothetical protein
LTRKRVIHHHVLQSQMISYSLRRNNSFAVSNKRKLGRASNLFGAKNDCQPSRSAILDDIYSLVRSSSKLRRTSFSEAISIPTVVVSHSDSSQATISFSFSFALLKISSILNHVYPLPRLFGSKSHSFDWRCRPPSSRGKGCQGLLSSHHAPRRIHHRGREIVGWKRISKTFGREPH